MKYKEKPVFIKELKELTEDDIKFINRMEIYECYDLIKTINEEFFELSDIEAECNIDKSFGLRIIKAIKNSGWLSYYDSTINAFIDTRPFPMINKKQYDIFTYHIKGYSDSDIAEVYKVSSSAIHHTVTFMNRFVKIYKELVILNHFDVSCINDYIPIEMLRISITTYNALKRGNIDVTKEIMEMIEDGSIFEIRGIGYTIGIQIANAIESFYGIIESRYHDLIIEKWNNRKN